MNDLTHFNAKRIERTQNRALEILDLLREEPNLTYPQILKTLAKRWDKSEDTVKRVFQYLQRQGLVKSEKVWKVVERKR
jgi:DNA-binding IclR family transcriptional regulator